MSDDDRLRTVDSIHIERQRHGGRSTQYIKNLTCNYLTTILYTGITKRISVGAFRIFLILPLYIQKNL